MGFISYSPVNANARYGIGVVEETRQNFASTSVTQPPALPLAPATRSSSQNQSQSNQLGSSQNTNANNTGRSSRLPRRHIPANQIFAELDTPDAPLSPASQEKSMSFSYIDMPESSCPVLPSLSVLAQTPRRQRRATISTPSPAPERSRRGDDNVFDAGTPSKKREKSRSIGNLDRHIRDVVKLELELNTGGSIFILVVIGFDDDRDDRYRVETVCTAPVRSS